jgi:hypothetical protein
MDARYTCLPYATLSQPPLLDRPQALTPAPVSLHDPAERVMTDFQHLLPLTIGGAASLGDANTKMIACGVRLLFVAASDGTISGLITASDILGDKPVRYLMRHGGQRDALRVRDLMTPTEQLEVVQYADVQRASVAGIVETLKLFGRQHLLVVAPAADTAGARIRGLFSSTQIARQLGCDLEIGPPTHTFAACHQALMQQ